MFFLFLPLLKNCQIDHINISREAEKELGVAVAARLKLSKDGTKVLWPQPTGFSARSSELEYATQESTIVHYYACISFLTLMPALVSKESLTPLQSVLWVIRHCNHICIGKTV